MPSAEAFLDTSSPDLSVRGFLHRPDAPTGDCLILTHGAGSNCRTPLLVALADAFCASGLTVLRCDLAFRQSRPTGPPPRGSAKRDQAGLGAAVSAMRRELGAPGLVTGVPGDRSSSLRCEGRTFLGGHSYGGRQASILAASDPTLVAALLLLSFPLHPPDRPTQLRSGHFPDLKTPALFIHGARDGFATRAEIEAALQLIPARTQLLSVPSAGHELLSVRNRRDFPPQVVGAFLAFTGSSTTN